MFKDFLLHSLERDEWFQLIQQKPTHSRHLSSIHDQLMVNMQTRHVLIHDYIRGVFRLIWTVWGPDFGEASAMLEERPFRSGSSNGGESWVIVCVSKSSSSPCSNIIANLYVDVTPATMVSRMDDNKTSLANWLHCTITSWTIVGRCRTDYT